ncbi:peptidoglycan-binding protein, partial [Acidovorax sp. GBBC 3334]|nr:peptidoglycan-binding protein [Acidovorax sp. GBBC 3334]
MNLPSSSSTAPSFLPSRSAAVACAALAAVLLSGCETTNMRMGSAESKTVATGAAAGEASANAS